MRTSAPNCSSYSLFDLRATGLAWVTVWSLLDLIGGVNPKVSSSRASVIQCSPTLVSLSLSMFWFFLCNSFYTIDCTWRSLKLGTCALKLSYFWFLSNTEMASMTTLAKILAESFSYLLRTYFLNIVNVIWGYSLSRAFWWARSWNFKKWLNTVFRINSCSWFSRSFGNFKVFGFGLKVAGWGLSNVLLNWIGVASSDLLESWFDCVAGDTYMLSPLIFSMSSSCIPGFFLEYRFDDVVSCLTYVVFPVSSKVTKLLRTPAEPWSGLFGWLLMFLPENGPKEE